MAEQQALKVAIKLHEGETVSTKIWRFSTTRDYTRDEVEREVASLFPHIIKKGLRLDLFYYDDLAGKIQIESDGDAQVALQSIREEWNDERRKDYLVLHAEDTCVQPQTTCAIDEPAPKKSTRKVCCHSSQWQAIS